MTRAPIREINVEDVFVVGNRRAVTDDAVKKLMESIELQGLHHPITVRFVDYLNHPVEGELHGAHVLVAGAHRLESYKRLGRKTIPCVVETFASDDDARLWEIAENLKRSELTALERSEHVAEWIKITERISSQLETKTERGRPASGVNKASRDLGVDRAAAHRAVKIASITPEAKKEAEATGLDDNASALLAVAKAEPERQVAVVRDIAEAKKESRNKIDLDVKSRAAREVAEMLAEHVPGEWWDGLKANLYASGAKNIADELTNITGQSLMDKAGWR